jgi:hypothetical protein
VAGLSVLGADQGQIIGSGLLIVCVVALTFSGLLIRRRQGGRPPMAAALRAPTPALEPVIERARIGIEALARQHAAIQFVTWIGAVEIDPKHLAFWIFTRTDAERDRLAVKAGLLDQLRQFVREAGYPRVAVPRVGFAFESKETVDRDWDGDYWRAMK